MSKHGDVFKWSVSADRERVLYRGKLTATALVVVNAGDEATVVVRTKPNGVLSTADRRVVVKAPSNAQARLVVSGRTIAVVSESGAAGEADIQVHGVESGGIEAWTGRSAIVGKADAFVEIYRGFEPAVALIKPSGDVRVNVYYTRNGTAEEDLVPRDGAVFSGFRIRVRADSVTDFEAYVWVPGAG